MEVDFKDCVLEQNELNLKESGLLFQTVTSKVIVVVDQLGFLAFSWQHCYDRAMWVFL